MITLVSTALALSRRHKGSITLLEAAPAIPNPYGSSVDSSRILRADYANPAYARLAQQALAQWRSTPWGHDGRYNRNGLVLVSSSSSSSSSGDHTYVRKSYENVKRLNPDAVELLPTAADVRRVVPGYGVAAHVSGGYVNWDSAWSDAESAVRHAKHLLDQTGRVTFLSGQAERLIIDHKNNKNNNQDQDQVTGVELSDGHRISADLVVLATGAWTGKLVDLRGRAEATGHSLAYLPLTDDEQRQLNDMPTVLNLSTGMFIIPPRNNELKIGRHAYGYRNPVQINHPTAPLSSSSAATTTTAAPIEVSLPLHGAPVPLEGQLAARAALREMLPALADRPFSKTRFRPKGDFIISYHPEIKSLFIATGGSGHGYKFLPVLGDKIVDAMQGILDSDLARLWAWTDNPVTTPAGGLGVVWTEDGSRSGARGMLLVDELEKSTSISTSPSNGPSNSPNDGDVKVISRL
ncbi:fructosyl amino acid oxidase, putative [Trichophyton benhamiae CBS 112371]|uniref:Fructosyl amino acid oxidase, putative n=1 Tax=Arthroderma benhamiae (strain ATCC MYA-4681 / CBS 112371) TaxID=663331 RepID=D4AMJ8_ARTBC|nr:fructosyl amino acid oxidase, putative [Trichophyton benhamiae CBS 112371]EFE35409.1 fructosyl amino acid oxidase, putative [Trichophyton benhamiae CBS 112371]